MQNVLNEVQLFNLEMMVYYFLEKNFFLNSFELQPKGKAKNPFFL